MSEDKGENMYDFDSEDAQTYCEQCECGKIIAVSTQEDDRPEYYTKIFIKCQCGRSVKFKLPVN